MLERRTFLALAGSMAAGVSLSALGGCASAQDAGSPTKGSSNPVGTAPSQASLGPDSHFCSGLPTGRELWRIDARDMAVSATSIWAVSESTLLSVDAGGLTSAVCDFNGVQALRVTASDACVCVALDDGSLACVDAKTGQLLWTASVVDAAGSTQTAEVSDGSRPTWTAIPVIMDETAAYALFSSTAFEPSCWMGALALADGNIVWRQPLSYAAQMANGIVGSWRLAGDAILTTTGGGVVDAIDARTGANIGAVDAEGWVTGGITRRMDGGYLIQLADGTIVSFAFADGSFTHVSIHRLTDAAPTVSGVHYVRPIDLGDAIICRVPADVYEEASDGSAARMKMTLGIVDAESFDVLDRLDDMDPQRQPLLLEASDGTALYVAAGNLLHRVELEGTSFGAASSLGVSVLDSEGSMYPEPLWCESVPAMLMPVGTGAFAAIG